MTIKAGVWIDHHKAVVVLLTDEGEDMQQISSESEPSRTTPGVVRVQSSYTPRDYTPEDKRDRKEVIHLNKYYDKVLACVHDAETIVVLGPGEAKGEFTKRIEENNFRGRVAPLRTVDKMTDPQIAAFVREHFH